MLHDFYDKWMHNLFHCPTFWRFRRAYTCPICGKKYRCYWDGHDVLGHGINICGTCFKKIDRERRIKEKINV